MSCSCLSSSSRACVCARPYLDPPLSKAHGGDRVSGGLRRRRALTRSRVRRSVVDTSAWIGCQPVDADGLSRVTPCPLRASQVVDGRLPARHRRWVARRAASVAATAAALVPSAARSSFSGPDGTSGSDLDRCMCRAVCCRAVGGGPAECALAVRITGPRRARARHHARD